MSGALEGRVVLVTGAGRGIGREHALLMAAHGAQVVVNDLGGATDGTGSAATAADEVVAEIVAAGGSAIANFDNVASFEGAQNMVASAVEVFGDLHAVVNNAGILRDRMLVSMSEEEFDAVVAVHMKGTFAVTHWAADHWRNRHKAGEETHRSIVNTSSGAGLHGNPGQTNYAAAKAGIAAMTAVWAAELGRYGVRVNCIAPIARTRLTLQTPGVSELMGGQVFDPGNISPLVAYLAGPQCDFTGQVFSVVGGKVGIYQGWSLAEEVSTPGQWTLESMTEAMGTLPRSVPVRTQFSALAGG